MLFTGPTPQSVQTYEPSCVCNLRGTCQKEKISGSSLVLTNLGISRRCSSSSIPTGQKNEGRSPGVYFPSFLPVVYIVQLAMGLFVHRLVLGALERGLVLGLVLRLEQNRAFGFEFGVE